MLHFINCFRISFWGTRIRLKLGLRFIGILLAKFKALGHLLIISG